TFLSSTAVSVHDAARIPNTKISRNTVSACCMGYWFGAPPGCCDPPGLPRRLLPRNRRFDFGFPSPAGTSFFFGSGCPARRALLLGLALCRFSSGFRLPLAPRRFFLLRSSGRVRLSWPTTYS